MSRMAFRTPPLRAAVAGGMVVAFCLLCLGNLYVKNLELVGEPQPFCETKVNPTDQTKHCQIYDLSQPSDQHFTCVDTNLEFKTKVCLYNESEDVFVSAYIKQYGSFEPQHVNFAISKLKQYPEAGFVDLGANIGMYTLTVASMGRKVVAVEPNIESVRRIHKAAQLSGTAKHITMVQNGISDCRTTAKLKLSRANQGNTVVVPGECDSNCISTILLDDLLEVITSKTIILKMDIEFQEHRAFLHAQRLLDTLHIPVIMTEFFQRRWWGVPGQDRTVTVHMLYLLASRGYVPHSEAGDPLDIDHWGSWPANVNWVLAVQGLGGYRKLPGPKYDPPHGPFGIFD